MQRPCPLQMECENIDSINTIRHGIPSNEDVFVPLRYQNIKQEPVDYCETSESRSIPNELSIKTEPHDVDYSYSCSESPVTKVIKLSPQIPPATVALNSPRPFSSRPMMQTLSNNLVAAIDNRKLKLTKVILTSKHAYYWRLPWMDYSEPSAKAAKSALVDTDGQKADEFYVVVEADNIRQVVQHSESKDASEVYYIVLRKDILLFANKIAEQYGVFMSGSDIESDRFLTFYKVTGDENPSIFWSFSLSTSLDVRMYVKSKRLPTDHELSAPVRTAKELRKRIAAIVGRYDVCIGNTDPELLSIDLDKTKVMYLDAGKCVRHLRCHWLASRVRGGGSRCRECSSIRRSLFKICSRLKASTCEISVHSNRAHSHMSREQLLDKLNLVLKENRDKSRRLNRLEMKLGVDVVESEDWPSSNLLSGSGNKCLTSKGRKSSLKEVESDEIFDLKKPRIKRRKR